MNIPTSDGRPLLVGLSLVPSCGGIPKTMEDFRNALNARIISFTDPVALESEGSALPNIEHVLSARNPLAKYYGYADTSSRRTAESIAANSNIIVCNVMFRYHAHWVRSMATKYKIPYWFIAHGQLDPYVFTYRAGIKKLWLQLFGKSLLRDASHVIFSTDREREKAAAIYTGSNCRVVHWPVELIPTNQRDEATARLHKQLNLPPDSRLLLYLGRLHSMKRPLETIKALAASATKNVHLLIVGPEYGVTKVECMKLASDLGIANRVHVMGPVYGPEKIAIMLACDGFISLSMRENFGYTTAESLSAELPVILSPGNDLGPELVPYKCGWILANDSEAEAVSAIKSFSEASRESLRERGVRGRSFVQRELSFDVFSYKLNDLMLEATTVQS